MSKRNHYIYPDLDTLAAAFVCELNKYLYQVNQLGKEVHIAMSGGSTPLAVFRQMALSTHPADWKLVHFWWVDERCVSPSSSESNYGNAHRLFLEALKIPQERIHRMRGEDEPRKEADRYAGLMNEKLPVDNGYPVFDWIWLGLGEDGHTASIFPNQLKLWKTNQACAVAIHPESEQKRITLTGGVINASKRVAILVSGRKKSPIINQIVMKEGNYLDFPATYIAPQTGYLEWYMDMEATSWMLA
jgi:6-phosphogluconolactonase